MGVDVGAAFEEARDHIPVAVPGGQAERRRAVGVAGVDAAGRRVEQGVRPFPEAERRGREKIAVRPRVQQELHRRGGRAARPRAAPLLRRRRAEWGVTAGVARVLVGPGVEQHLRHLFVAGPGGPVQRGRAVVGVARDRQGRVRRQQGGRLGVAVEGRGDEQVGRRPPGEQVLREAPIVGVAFTAGERRPGGDAQRGFAPRIARGRIGTGGQKPLGQVHPGGAARERVQRRGPGRVGAAGVGAAGEQQRGDLLVTVPGRPVQRRPARVVAGDRQRGILRQNRRGRRDVVAVERGPEPTRRANRGSFDGRFSWSVSCTMARESILSLSRCRAEYSRFLTVVTGTPRNAAISLCPYSPT
jgi:hypothetical protein